MRYITFAAALLFSTNVNADIVSDAWGIATDPLKLDAATENSLQAIREARSAALAVIAATGELQSELDSDIRDYLLELDGMISDIDALGASFIGEISSLTARITNHAIQVLQEVECTAIRVGENTVGDQVINRLPVILTDNTVIYQMPFGTQRRRVLGGILPWFGEEPATLVIDKREGLSDFDEFRRIEEAYLESLALAPLDGDAVLIPATYGNLANIAARTACLYGGTNLESMFLARKFAEYNAMIIPWGKAVQIDF